MLRCVRRIKSRLKTERYVKAETAVDGYSYQQRAYDNHEKHVKFMIFFFRLKFWTKKKDEREKMQFRFSLILKNETIAAISASY